MSGRKLNIIKIVIMLLTLEFNKYYKANMDKIHVRKIFYLYIIILVAFGIVELIKDGKITYMGISRRLFFHYKPLVIDLIFLLLSMNLLIENMPGIIGLFL